MNERGTPKSLLANAITALRSAPEWAGVLGYNDFSLTVVAVGAAPWGSVSGEWTDHEDRLTADWLQHQGINVGVEVAGQAVQVVGHDRQLHPVREYLDTLAWDGQKRIDNWLARYLGVEPSNYVCAVGSRWLISAVARIYRPGCKADCCLILEGPQGIQKSTALQALAGQWFTDQVAELGSKDASLQTRGVWVIELAELDAMTRTDVAKIKAFMSRGTDRFRPPYGKRVIESRRQCVFAGSVNHSTYLRDETGGRRFWPVLCHSVDVDGITRDRNQLWGEARERFKSGAKWWLDTEYLVSEAEREQADRYEADAWDALILEWAAGRLAAGHDSVSVGEVLELCIQKKADQWTRLDQMRVGRCLTQAKWERYRDRKRDMEWRYRPPVPTSSRNNREGGNAVNA
jgi:predicted P-loop ATPase